ncbi:MAG: alpha/beta hydrolase, partial [Dysgonamonadaceae bacterium]
MKKSALLFIVSILSGFLYSQVLTNPFQSYDLSIECETGKIFGTLLIPNTKAPFPVALLISGSGPTDRDGNQPNMKNNSL